VEDLLEGQIEANQWIADNSDDAKQLVGDYIANLTGGEIPAAALDKGWSHLTFTNDPIADSLIGSYDHAVATGQLEEIDGLENIYHLDPLNKLLADAGEPEVSGPSS
jgi:NitT/TauT family transport system substrate-binding protein